MASDALKRRLLTVAVAGLAAAIGLLLAGGFAAGYSRYLAFGVAWFSVAVALMLEPFPRGSVSQALLAAAGGALGGGVLTLGAMVLIEQSWYSPGETQSSLGARLGYVWSAGDAVRIVVVLTLAALPAPLTLLLVRRSGRQLEWQAGAAALGPMFVGAALYPGDIFSSSALLLLFLAGLPFGLGAYLLDRRLLGPDAVAFFPEVVPLAPVEPVTIEPATLEPATLEPATIEPVTIEPVTIEPVTIEPVTIEPATESARIEHVTPPLPARPRTAPVPFVGLAPLGPLLAALVLAPAWAFVVNRAGKALAPSGTFPGMPELTAIFDDVAARQEEHRARTGSYARTLGALETLPLDVRGGLTHGYVLRYAQLGATRWVLTADPVPARPGWPSLRLVGPGGQLDRGSGPFLLQAEEP